MASYKAWNQALSTYFTEGVPIGEGIFLSVDEDVLSAIGEEIVDAQQDDDASQDFQAAVRRQVVLEGHRVSLGRLHGRNEQDTPLGLAFLCAMVLAASHMAEEGYISPINYFRRLREVLNLPTEDGRPPGMESGAEEALWQEWNLHLSERGFLPTARGRGDSAMKYIGYPISQALLRQSDKATLRRLFSERHWTSDWEPDTLLGRVGRESQALTQHLREDLLLVSGPRLQAVAAAIHEVYETWKDAPDLIRGASSTGRGANLLAGLLRTEDPFMGNIQYHLYPRQPRGRRATEIEISYRGVARHLKVERAGWLEPLDPVSEAELDAGAHYTITHPDYLQYLILPPRHFWILRSDPENPDSGTFASWGRPPLGTQFVILLRGHLLPQLELLRNERLIEWSGEARPISRDGEWLEVQHCMVVSAAWSGVFIADHDLYDALRPIATLELGIAGGLRVPGISGWLDQHGPQLTVFGFDPLVEVRVVESSRERVIFDESVPTNKPVGVAWPGPGNYRVEASCGAESAERVVRIIDWEELRSTEPSAWETIQLGNWQLCGAALKPVPPEGS